MPTATTPRVITQLMTPRPVRSRVLSTTSVAPPRRVLTIVEQPIDQLRQPARRLRKPSKGQIEAAAAGITRFNVCPPFLVTEEGELIDRPEVFEACKRLGWQSVPTICIKGMSDAEVKAFRLLLHKNPERATWDMEALAAEFEEILALDPDLLAFTGFTMSEIDVALASFALGSADDEDSVPAPSGPAVSRLGDLWTFTSGGKLLCSNARETQSYRTLLGNERVQMVLSDPPYGCRVKGHVSRSHDEFVEGSGLNEGEALVFFQSFLDVMTPHLCDGAIVDLFIDAAGMLPLQQALRAAGLRQLTIAVWDKGAGGMGSLYRQQVEFVLVSKWGRATHINNVELGRHGRNRTTRWEAPGLAQFGAGRSQALALHPTVKPVGLLFEALLDTSRRGGVVLDPFAGSGSTLLAAHRAQRLGRAIELDPGYVDVAVRRMERLTGQPAHHAGTGLTFAAMAERRAAETASAAATAVTAALPAQA